MNVEVGGGHKVFVVGTWLLRLRDEIAEERARGVVGGEQIKGRCSGCSRGEAVGWGSKEAEGVGEADCAKKDQ